MKRCHECNRTYSDETISFCLADGSLLSASYDPSKDAPPTEILPTPTRAAMPPTQAAKPLIPTITSFPAHHGFAVSEDDGAQPLRNSRRMLWIVWALTAVAIGVGLVVAVRYGLQGRNESASASN